MFLKILTAINLLIAVVLTVMLFVALHPSRLLIVGGVLAWYLFTLQILRYVK